MPTISSKISKKEYDAITNYANACGETTSNLIRKVLINQATFMGGFSGPAEYECNIMIPEGATSEEDDKITKDTWNYSRRVLGIEEIDEI